MDVRPHLLAGERPEVGPRPGPQFVDLPRDLQPPLVERDVRRGSGGENREVGGQVLPRREPLGGNVVATLPPEASRDRAHPLTLSHAYRSSSAGPRARPA